jgi:transcriptional regulator with XRE-family HTH domain
VSRRNLFRDDCGSRRGIVAYPFCHIKLSGLKPLPPGYPTEINTLGDHIRAIRLKQNLKQEEVAKELGVTTDTITGWELNRHSPMVHHYPKIYSFIGYMSNGIQGDSLGSRIKNYRLQHGLQHKQLAKQIGIDEATLKRVERGEKYFEKTREKVVGLLKKTSR